MIYVDPLIKTPISSNWKWEQACHMFSIPNDGETVEQSYARLHEFAAKLGLMREWFHGDHYDLTPRKRLLAIALGARPVERRSVEMIQWLKIRKGES